MLSTSDTAALVAHFGVDDPGDTVARPSYNIAPTQELLIVTEDEDLRQLGAARWGLVPSWAADAPNASGLINARAETVTSKPSFRSAFRRRPCLIPADGFYEWKRPEGRGAKRPHVILPSDGKPFAFAGLWEDRPSAEGTSRRTCTVITCAANATMAPIHHRMPVILSPETWDTWLDVTSTDPTVRQTLLAPAPDEVLVVREISTAVNNVRHDGPHLLDPPEVVGLPGI